MMWTKICASLILIVVASISGASIAFAQCQVCTVAVMGGVGVSRWLKIDDTIAGLWVGAMLVSISWWTINWLNKKNISFIGRKPLVVALYYFLTIAPLYWTNFIGHPMNKIWGIDKLVAGTALGSIIFFAIELWYIALKEKNGGRPHFPFQKVVMPVAGLIVGSGILYFALK